MALFVALETQWRWHPMIGLRTGIDYAAIGAVAAASAIAMTPALFNDLRTLEGAAMETWAKSHG